MPNHEGFNRINAVRLCAAGFLLICSLPILAGTEAVSLRYRYREGQVLTLRRDNHLVVHSDSFPGGKMEIDYVRVETMTVDKTRDDGEIEFVTRTESSVMKMDGEEVAAKNDLSGLPTDLVLRMVMDPLGNVEDLHYESDVKPEDRARVENLLENVKQRNFVFPENHVQPGDSWSDDFIQSIDVPNLGQLDITLELHSTLKGVETFRGVRCARIVFDGKGTGTFNEGIGTLTITLEGTLIHALEQGVTLDTRQTEKVHLSLVLPDGPREIQQDHRMEDVLVSGAGKEVQAP